MIKTNFVKMLSKIYKRINNPVKYDTNEYCVFNREKANKLVYDLLKDGKPAMISRFGSIELAVTNTVRIMKTNNPMLSKIADFIFEKTDLPWMDKKFYLPIERNAGVFKPTDEILWKFGNLYLEDSKEIDLLMSIYYKEKWMPLPRHCKYIHFESIYPFWVDNPWSRILKDKKVLVIYPFADSISKQYKNRENLFDNKLILPRFELITYKPVQSAAYEEVDYVDWFEALNKMKSDIDKIEFDIALIGCGAYGLPLAAHIKRMGKQAVHMGGGVQLLFGIKGGRWEDPNYIWWYKTPEEVNLNYRDLFNEYWVKPAPDEIPRRASEVENACYW